MRWIRSKGVRVHPPSSIGV